MADRDDMINDTDEEVRHAENPWRPAPRHAASGKRHIANIKAMLQSAPTNDRGTDRPADQWATAGL